MAATAEALARQDRTCRPDLRVIPGGKGRVDRRTLFRRRMLLLATVAAVAFAAGLAVASSGSQAAGERSPVVSSPAQAEELTVVVAPGDTVWDLAREHLPAGMGVSDFAAEIVAANDLDPTALRPGTVVRLPVAAQR